MNLFVASPRWIWECKMFVISVVKPLSHKVWWATGGEIKNTDSTQCTCMWANRRGLKCAQRSCQEMLSKHHSGGLKELLAHYERIIVESELGYTRHLNFFEAEVELCFALKFFDRVLLTFCQIHQADLTILQVRLQPQSSQHRRRVPIPLVKLTIVDSYSAVISSSQAVGSSFSFCVS